LKVPRLSGLSGWNEARAVKPQASSSTDSASIPVQSFGFIATSMIQDLRFNRPLYTRGDFCLRRSSCISTTALRFHSVWPQRIFALLSLMLAHTFAYPVCFTSFCSHLRSPAVPHGIKRVSSKALTPSLSYLQSTFLLSLDIIPYQTILVGTKSCR
jgi:hypothetical protein